ncbi:Hypothetical predicted protein [Paramuricea clavata]|uniref:Uncharacterized protein n=1 Tax=Paramuricea clavata TaxID=317549 RepID=A0A6S7GXU2_PARCT|nr:Hypothetical predicted protein [Paramuricea clavata]
MFDKNGYAKEAHRHNLAMENLTAEREKYLEEVTDRRNRIAQLKSELAEANKDINSTNKSLELVRRINELTRKAMPRMPQLSNHYKPSSEIEEYMAIFGLITEMDWLQMVTPEEVIALGKRVDAIEELEAAVKKEMEWLIMATPEEIVRVGKTDTVEELEAAVRKYVESRIKIKHTYDPVCSECGSKSIVMIDGADTCTQCGTSDMNNFTYYVSYNHNKDDYLKKKSCHNRVRWFERHLFEHVASRDRDTIREQFRSIVRCIQRLRLQRGRNIVRYKFYLLRIASMNGITLRNPPEDIKTQRIVDILEDILYGKVFVELGWKPEKCKYYDNWKSKNT